MKFFEVFKAGTYPQGNFTQAEVRELAKNYDPEFCEAPITLDHEQKGPAYGWVESLKEENGTLKASFKDLADDLKEFVQKGKYKKISVEIYRELEGKKPYLKAVSFLGASIPQVKGMKAVEFRDAESETYVFDTTGGTGVTDITGGTNTTGGTGTTDTTDETEELKTTIKELEKQIADFQEKAKKNTEIKELKSQVKDLNIQLAKFKNEAEGKEELARELKEIKENLRNKDFNEFIDKQIETGILTPANKDAVFSILCDLDNVKKFDETSDGVNNFKTFISALPKQIEFNELAKKTTDKPTVDVEKYAEADEESLEIYKEATALAEKEKISFRDALLRIKK